MLSPHTHPPRRARPRRTPPALSAALAALLSLAAAEARAQDGAGAPTPEAAPEPAPDAPPPDAPPPPAPASPEQLAKEGDGAPAAGAGADGGAAQDAEEEPKEDARKPQEAKDGAAAQKKKEPAGPSLSGSIFSRVRGRYTHREGDQDTFSGLLLTLRPTEGVEFHFKGDLFVDAGRDRSRRQNELADVYDTWSASAQGRAQEAYLRLQAPVLEGFELRAGRQFHLGNQALQFDGLWASLALSEQVSLRTYGGLPVYFYKSPWRGDALGGAAVDVRPTSRTTLTLEYLHLTEGRLHGGFRHDDLYSLQGEQVLFDWLTVRARGEVLDDNLRSAEAQATLVVPGIDLQLRGRYYVLFKKQDAQTNTVDPFSDVLGPESPYQTAEASLFQGIAGVVGLELFYSHRDVIDTADEQAYNHDYHRYGGAFHVYDVPLKGLTFSVTFENWEVEGKGGADTRQLSGELSLRANDVVTASLGTTYMLYKYDQLAAKTREDVRLYFARLRLRWADHSFDFAYEFEHDSLDDFHVARVGYRYDF
ncbi:MAG: hypothetical protein AB7N76_18665 [Planctomycetota bacterium]